MIDISEYVRARNKAAMGSLDEFAKWANSVSEKRPNKIVMEMSYHKIRTAIPSLPIEERMKSKAWLSKHSLRSMDDGDLST